MTSAEVWERRVVMETTGKRIDGFESTCLKSERFLTVCDAESSSGEVKGQRSQRADVSGPR